MSLKQVFLIVIAVASLNAAPIADSSSATIIHQEYITTNDGYRFEYETSDGQTRREEGKLITDADGTQYMKVASSATLAPMEKPNTAAMELIRMAIILRPLSHL
ncbi:uncharacterized protein LOC110675468 [Aedes aegypti]|uniref:Uncharacterized protein n=1 Tax=Aedes aegypti TaxID=7159 RepID=A0A6I8U2X4_AEDAE|nr:uncharacterized protein LOC110675468 [Aedes aegypti]